MGDQFPWEGFHEPEKRELVVADLKLIKYACQQTAKTALKENTRNRFGAGPMEQLKTFLSESVLARAEGLPKAVNTQTQTVLPPAVGGSLGEQVRRWSRFLI